MPETAITFGATDGFGTFAGWELQSDSKTTAKERSMVLDATGNEVASNLFNEKTEYSSVYKCSNNTNTVPSEIGDIYNSRALISIAINTSNSDRAQMTLTGHQHAANPHTTLVKAAHGISVAKAFGAVDFLGGTGGTGASPASGTITITCQHEDNQDADGAHLVGENYNCTITSDTTWTGPVTTNAGTGWDVTKSEPATTNTGHVTTNVSGIKAVAMA